MVDEKKDAKALVASILGGGSPEPLDDHEMPAGEHEVTREPPDDHATRAGEHEVTRTLPAIENQAATGDRTLESAPAADGPTAADPDAAEAEARELIDVYFELEEPSERDSLFDQLVAIEAPVVTEFLRVMMHEDEDEYVRAAAAAELARRGVAEAIEVLTNDLEDPEEPFFFEQAVQVLAEVLGSGFYDTLITLWQDPNRDADQRREAMLGLESIDAERALAEFVTFIEGITDIQAMADDQVEVAMMAFARHEFTAARPALEALRQRVAAAPLDEDERTELVGFLDEGLALI